MRFLILLFLLLQCGVASAWTSIDTKYEIAYQVVAAMDWKQTYEVAENNDEINPMLGLSPTTSAIDRYFIFTGLLHFGVSKLLKNKNRRKWQRFSLGFEAFSVARNITLGYSF